MQFALIGNIGTWEIILILFAALMVFGPGKLPEVAKTIGKTLGEIKKVTSGVQKEFQDAINLEADSGGKKLTPLRTADKTNKTDNAAQPGKNEVTDIPLEVNDQNIAADTPGEATDDNKMEPKQPQ